MSQPTDVELVSVSVPPATRPHETNIPYSTAHDDTSTSTHQRPRWYVTYTHKRHRWLQPLQKNVVNLPALRLYLNVGELLFGVLYLCINAAVLAVLIVQFVQSDSNATAAPSSRGRPEGGDTTNGAASALGIYGTFLMALALVPVTRNSILAWLLNLPIDRAIVYHQWQAYFATLVLAAHGGCYIAYYGNTSVFPSGISSQLFDGAFGLNESGLIAWSATAALVITSLPPIRRHLFEVFYRLHIPLFLLFVLFAAVHQGAAIGILAVPLILYAIDIVQRIRISRRKATIIGITPLPDGVIRIVFDKQKFHYSSGQYVFLCIPQISRFEFHPFSLSSSPHHEHMAVHCRVLGNWTKELAQLAMRYQHDSPPPITLYVDGPYGSLTTPLHKHVNFVFVSGGIGITPLQSIYNSLIHQWKQQQQQLRHVEFVWSVREDATYSYLTEVDKFSVHHKGNHLGVLPPFHTPLLLETYDSQFANQQPTNEHPLIRTHFHLTNTARDSITLVQPQQSVTWTKTGRPDIEQILAAVAESNGGVNECMVLVCGPASLARSVRAAIKVSSRITNMKYSLHEEGFEL